MLKSFTLSLLGSTKHFFFFNKVHYCVLRHQIVFFSPKLILRGMHIPSPISQVIITKTYISLYLIKLKNKPMQVKKTVLQV